MTQKILDYRDEETRSMLVSQTRFNSNSKKKFRLLLSDGMIIKTEAPRCLANLMIFRVLDYYKVKDNRKEYIFTGDYLKGSPVVYMTKVLDLIEKDSYFRFKQSEDNFVVLLPHLLASIKEVFYTLAIIVDGIIMTDHSLWSYIKGYRDCKPFRKLMTEPVISEHDAPWVIKRKMDKMLSLFDKDITIHPLSDFYRSGVKVNRNQLMMFLVWG